MNEALTETSTRTPNDARVYDEPVTLCGNSINSMRNGRTKVRQKEKAGFERQRDKQYIKKKLNTQQTIRLYYLIKS